MGNRKKFNIESIFDPDVSQKIQAFQSHVNIDFDDPELLFRSLCHTSYVHEQIQMGRGERIESNERLEFLGDSVLGLIVVEELFSRFPEMAEGSLAKIKAVIASEAILSKSAHSIGLGQYLFLGKGELHSGGTDRDSTLADAFEALCGAIYLDQGITTIRAFLQQHLFPFIQQVVDHRMWVDHKTQLQEMTQYLFKELPEYTLLKVEGPPHQPSFIVQVSINSDVYAQAVGRSKKEAEQSAAMIACKKIREENPQLDASFL